MSKFLKLTSMIINKNHINKIIIHPNKYDIYLNHNINGFYFIGCGLIISHEVITVCENKSPIDYKNISDWIIFSS
jgi:hypothetical protein